MRYNEIQRRIGGISQRMLTLTLKRLEMDGIVTRTLFPSVPPRVHYELTELGQTLRGALVPLGVWAAKNKETIAANRLHSEARGKNGRSPAGTAEPESESEGIDMLKACSRARPPMLRPEGRR